MLSVFSILLLLPLIFLPTVTGMVSVWLNNETFTHGLLIFPISFWLIWKKKDLINQAQQRLEPKALFLMIPALGLWVLSYLVDVQITQQFAFIFLLQATLWFLLGTEIIKLILFPVLFLTFSVPFGQILIPPLMDFTANFAVHLVQLTGIPIYQEGLIFSLPTGNWSVVEECSGVRYLIASTVLGTLFAYMSYSSYKKRIIFIIISMLLPILANSLRAFGIVMIGHLSGMTLATGIDHIIYGWVFFGLVIFLLFYIGSYWADPHDSFKLPPPRKITTTTPINHKSVILAHGLTYLVLAIVVYSLNIKPETNDVVNDIPLPASFSQWHYKKGESLPWHPIINNAGASISRVYQSGSNVIQLDIGYFPYQKNGAEAVSSMNHIASPLGGKWRKVHGDTTQNKDFPVTETELESRPVKFLVWHWYQVGPFVTPNKYMAKLYDAYNQIFLHRNDAAMISIAINLDEDTTQKRKILHDFLNASANNITQTINALKK